MATIRSRIDAAFDRRDRTTRILDNEQTLKPTLDEEIQRLRTEIDAAVDAIQEAFLIVGDELDRLPARGREVEAPTPDVLAR